MSIPLTMSNLKELLDEMYSAAEAEGNGTAMSTILDIQEEVEVSFHEAPVRYIEKVDAAQVASQVRLALGKEGEL
ncbi:hypothetical protein [Corynebacterium sp. KPL2838]|uniref:hypothetical protein n=1 Tax=Corynebacterium sp. KPL2838 TaxID=3158316 RepID=UPI0032EF8541